MNSHTLSTLCATAPKRTSFPEDFNPETHPILAVHYFGCQPPGQAEPDRAILDLAFQRNVERLHQLGPRPQCELLREIGNRYDCTAFIEERLKVYAELDPNIVAALGGDHFPPAPIREVGS